MARIVRSSEHEEIVIPASLMSELKLRDGDSVKAIVDGESLRLVRLDRFLSLRGVLADDEDFEQAIKLLVQSWDAWKPPASA